MAKLTGTGSARAVCFGAVDEEEAPKGPAGADLGVLWVPVAAFAAAVAAAAALSVLSVLSAAAAAGGLAPAAQVGRGADASYLCPDRTL